MAKLLKIVFFLIVFQWPVFSQFLSSFEHASVLGKKQFELSGFYNNFGVEEEVFPGFETRIIRNHSAGISLAMGLNNTYDLRISYSKILNNRFDITNLFVITPKRYIIKDRLSASLPLGIYVGDGFALTAGPKLIYSYPVLQNLDITFSVKADYLLPSDFYFIFEYTLSPGLHNKSKTWYLRPEFGVSVLPIERATTLTAGASFHYRFR